MKINSFTILYLIFLFLSPSLTIKLNSRLKAKKKYSQFLHQMQQSGQISKNKPDFVLEQNSKNAIQALKAGLPALRNDTSCKVAAKYVLYTIGHIEKEEDRHNIPITNNTEEDLSNIKELLKDGYVLQIEVRPNHHFTCFLQDGEKLYVMQAFQNLFRLRDWIYDPFSSKPMTLDRFIGLLRSALNKDNNKEDFITTLLQLFLPHDMWKSYDKIKGLADWFRFYNYITLIKIDYVKYNFGNAPKNNKNFVYGFDYVDHHFLIY